MHPLRAPAALHAESMGPLAIPSPVSHGCSSSAMPVWCIQWALRGADTTALCL